MPKLKTHKGAAKRFKQTASGRIKHRSAFRNHILTHKSKKTKRQLRHNVMLHPSDIPAVERMLHGS